MSYYDFYCHTHHTHFDPYFFNVRRIYLLSKNNNLLQLQFNFTITFSLLGTDKIKGLSQASLFFFSFLLSYCNCNHPGGQLNYKMSNRLFRFQNRHISRTTWHAWLVGWKIPITEGWNGYTVTNSFIVRNEAGFYVLCF